MNEDAAQQSRTGGDLTEARRPQSSFGWKSLTKALSKLSRKFQTIPFYLGRPWASHVFLNYQPDSFAGFNAHPEFGPLYRKFSKSNRRINGGDAARLWSYILNLKQIVAEGIEGDFAELGVWRGNTAAVMAHIALEANRQVYLFDTFEGPDQRDLTGIDAGEKQLFNNTSIDMVKEIIGEASKICHFTKGYFPDSVEKSHRTKKFAAVSLDCDLYEPTQAGLKFFYPLMPRGGVFLLHDYSSMRWAGAKKAIDDFCKQSGEFVVLMPDKSGSAFIRKAK